MFMNFHAFSMKNNNNQWKSILHGSRFTIGFPIVNIDEIGGGQNVNLGAYHVSIVPRRCGGAAHFRVDFCAY